MRLKVSVNARQGQMDIETIRDLIVPIAGYDEQKRRMLCGELERLRWSLEWIARQSGGSLLDLGSSGELVPVYRAMLGYEHVCCLDLACVSGQRRLIHANGSTFEYDAHQVDLDREPYPFPGASFDQVVCMEVIEHLCVDPMFMLAEINRVLKPGGRLLLTTPNITSLASVYLQIWGQHPAIGRQTYGPGITDRHNREYTPGEIRTMLAAAGFDVQQLDTFDPSPPSAPVRRVGGLLNVLKLVKQDIDCGLRGRVIRYAGVKAGSVVERFPEVIYPRYGYYDYAAYDRELTRRFDGRRYWQSSVVPDAGQGVPTNDECESVYVTR